MEKKHFRRLHSHMDRKCLVGCKKIKKIECRLFFEREFSPFRNFGRFFSNLELRLHFFQKRFQFPTAYVKNNENRKYSFFQNLLRCLVIFGQFFLDHRLAASFAYGSEAFSISYHGYKKIQIGSQILFFLRGLGLRNFDGYFRASS